MDEQVVKLEDLEQLVATMLQQLPQLDCPECCDCGPVYQYMELSARIYREEWEWACLANVLIHVRHSKHTRGSQPT